MHAKGALRRRQEEANSNTIKESGKDHDVCCLYARGRRIHLPIDVDREGHKKNESEKMRVDVNWSMHGSTLYRQGMEILYLSHYECIQGYQGTDVVKLQWVWKASIESASELFRFVLRRTYSHQEYIHYHYC